MSGDTGAILDVDFQCEVGGWDAMTGTSSPPVKVLSNQQLCPTNCIQISPLLFP